mmetsp:Transcript_3749/g.9727  ORF Transcript_3749/g.9727 Transcript_3749/m.9727 type:complete len:170 (+) Transcript_3749:206-715(+)
MNKGAEKIGLALLLLLLGLIALLDLTARVFADKGSSPGGAMACRQLWQAKEANYALAEHNWRLVLEQVRNESSSMQLKSANRMQRYFDPFEPLWNCEARDRVGAGLRYASIGDGTCCARALPSHAAAPCLHRRAHARVPHMNFGPASGRAKIHVRIGHADAAVRDVQHW